jgi:Ca-activated chloride channel family protein
VTRRAIVWAATCVALALLAGVGPLPAPAARVASASGGQNPAPTPTFRTRGEGVRIDVLVTDREKPVAGLTTKDFALTDSGADQVVEAASLAEMPLDVILVLDLSVSLGEEGLVNLTRGADALLARLRPTDRAALVTFSQVVMIRSGLTTEHERVRGMVKGLRVKGMTSAIDAAYTGMTLQQGADRPTLMLVFTDGLDTQSWLRADAVLDTARYSVVVPYAVVAGDGVKPFTARRPSLLSGGGPTDPSARFLWELVQAGGGLFMNAEATNQLERRFTEALDNFRQRYILTYVPRGVDRNGWHPVTIAVKNRGYRIRARPGYFVR